MAVIAPSQPARAAGSTSDSGFPARATSQHPAVDLLHLASRARSTAHDSRPRAPAERRADEMARAGRAHSFVLLVQGGMPVREALAKAGCEFTSDRWVTQTLARYRAQGLAGLYDGRRANGKQATFPNEVRSLLIGLALKHRSAGWRTLHGLLKQACEHHGFAVPSEPWVKWFWMHKVDDAIKRIREGGLAAYEKFGAPVGVWDPAEYGNHWWQADNNNSDIWLQRFNRAGDRLAAGVWTSGAIDVFTRAVTGLSPSHRNPDAWTTALLLRHAILPKDDPGWGMHGSPGHFSYDLGREFDNHPVHASIQQLKIIAEPCMGANPNEKGEIERFWRTFQDNLLPRLPGYKPDGMKSREAAQRRVKELLDLKEFREEARRWLTLEYLPRKHEGISGGDFDHAPGPYWNDTVRLTPVPADDLDVLLLQSDTVRRIGRRGIRLTLKGRKMIFASAALGPHIGEQATLRLNPDDLLYQRHGTPSVLVYGAVDGRRICEAFLQPERGSSALNAEIRAERTRLRKNLKARMREHVKHVETHDRENPREFDEARALAAAAPPPPRPAPAESPDVLSLVAAMERRDRA